MVTKYSVFPILFPPPENMKWTRGQMKVLLVFRENTVTIGRYYNQRKNSANSI
jgi:hypothetical protein